MSVDPTIADVLGPYLTSIVLTLNEHRPELTKPRKGRWEGPLLFPQAPAGIWFKRGSLSLCISPWAPLYSQEPTDVSSRWLHASLSHPSRDPTYAELLEVRARFFRPDDTVLHVFPPKAEHFSMHAHCLHLWCTLDGHRPIPDLRGTGGGV